MSIRIDLNCPFTLYLLLLFLLLPAYAYAGPQIVTAMAATQDATLTGYTRARTVLDLSAETTGKIEDVFVDIGGSIGNNLRFACMDKTFINLEIDGNNAEITRTEIDISYFSKQVDRHRKLVSKNSSSQLQLDDFERSLATARQQLRTLQVKARELAERRRRHCMKAPEGWTVMERYIEPGEWIKAGDPVAKIGNFAQLLIPYAVSLSEYEALSNASGPVSVTIPDLNVSIPAHIERVSPAFDEQSRKIVLDLEIENSLDKLRAGIRADLRLKIPTRANTVVLPERAVDKRYEQYWLERESGEPVSVVFLGRSEDNGEKLIRLSAPNVKPGDRFIVPGNTRARSELPKQAADSPDNR